MSEAKTTAPAAVRAGGPDLRRLCAAFADRLAGGAGQDATAWWSKARRDAHARFVEHGLPAADDEDWRSTPLTRLAAAPFAPAPWTVPGAEALRRTALEDSVRVVLVNGRFVRNLFTFDLKPAGLAVGSFEDALAAGTPRVERLFTAPRPVESACSLLNTAFFENAVMIQVAPGAELGRPIEILSFVTESGAEGAADAARPLILPRIFLVAEKGCRATLIERHLTLPGAAPAGPAAPAAPAGPASLVNLVFDALLEPGSSIEHVVIGDQSRAQLHVAMNRVEVQRDASYRSRTVTLGGGLVRNDLHVALTGPGASCELLGLYSLGGEQHVDHHTFIDHRAPDATSVERYKGVLGGRSRGIFHGRIVVRPGALRTSARQTNNNLILSDDARAESTPQLEIHADDVQCRHGSTIGRLDELALFYVRSRGIGKDAARQMLTFAFANEIIEGIGHPALRRALAARLVGGSAADLPAEPTATGASS